MALQQVTNHPLFFKKVQVKYLPQDLAHKWQGLLGNWLSGNDYLVAHLSKELIPI